MGRGVAAVVGIVALAGCTEAEPIVTQTPTLTVESPSPTPTASPSPSPTAAEGEALSDEELLALMPPAADRPDVQGAVVTAEFFLEQYAPMFHTGDTSVWDALSLESCGFCANAAENALQVLDLGWTASGGEVSVRQPPLDAYLESAGLVYVVYSTSHTEAALVDGDGREQSRVPATTREHSMQMELVGSVWRIAGVAVEERD